MHHAVDIVLLATRPDGDGCTKADPGVVLPGIDLRLIQQNRVAIALAALRPAGIARRWQLGGWLRRRLSLALIAGPEQHGYQHSRDYNCFAIWFPVFHVRPLLPGACQAQLDFQASAAHRNCPASLAGRSARYFAGVPGIETGEECMPCSTNGISL